MMPFSILSFFFQMFQFLVGNSQTQLREQIHHEVYTQKSSGIGYLPEVFDAASH